MVADRLRAWLSLVDSRVNRGKQQSMHIVRITTMVTASTVLRCIFQRRSVHALHLFMYRTIGTICVDMFRRRPTGKTYIQQTATL